MVDQPAYMQPQKPSSKANARRRLLTAAGIVLFAAVGAYLALIVVSRLDEVFLPGTGIHFGPFGKQLPGVDAGKNDGPSEPEERINLLVMGLDRRPSEGQAPARTDTMFVVTIDPQAKTAGILGIPRDLWVDIPGKRSGYFSERINTAYVIGTLDKYPGGGPGLAMRVVEQTLGIDLDHYVVIDFEGFVKVIDALGGIDVDVPEDVSDPYYSWTESPGDFDPQYFESGVQHMDGETALAYSRIRRYSNDLDRIQRQQRVIFATMDKVISIDALTNAVDLWKRFKGAISTDINDLQIPGLAALAAKISPDNVSALSLGAAVSDYTTEQGAAVLIADEAAMRRIVNALFADSSLIKEKASIAVVNGAGSPGLADDVVTYLVDVGFAAGNLMSDDEGDGEYYPESRIIVYRGKTKTAERLAEVLGLSADAISSAEAGDSTLNDRNADIVVIVGADARIGPRALGEE